MKASDLSSTKSVPSPPPTHSLRDEVEPADREDGLVSIRNNTVQASPFKSFCLAPSSLGPYMTQAQLPDPVSIPPAPRVMRETTYSSGTTLLENFKSSALHKQWWHQRPANRFPIEAEAAGQD